MHLPCSNHAGSTLPAGGSASNVTLALAPTGVSRDKGSSAAIGNSSLSLAGSGTLSAPSGGGSSSLLGRPASSAEELCAAIDAARRRALKCTDVAPLGSDNDDFLSSITLLCRPSRSAEQLRAAIDAFKAGKLLAAGGSGSNGPLAAAGVSRGSRLLTATGNSALSLAGPGALSTWSGAGSSSLLGRISSGSDDADSNLISSSSFLSSLSPGSNVLRAAVDRVKAVASASRISDSSTADCDDFLGNDDDDGDLLEGLGPGFDALRAAIDNNTAKAAAPESLFSQIAGNALESVQFMFCQPLRSCQCYLLSSGVLG
jgi:hypothetical protein